MPTFAPTTAASRKATRPPEGWAAGTGLPPEAVLEVDGYIRARAGRMAPRAPLAGLEFEDLVQEGRAGALEAAQRFDASRGVKFLTFAAYSIEGAMRSALQGSLVHVPQGQLKPYVSSLSTPVDEAGDQTQGDQLGDLDQDTFEHAAHHEALQRLRRALPRLEAGTREVLSRHLGLQGHEPQKVTAIAQAMGISRARVEKLLGQGLDQLRQHTLRPAA